MAPAAVVLMRPAAPRQADPGGCEFCHPPEARRPATVRYTDVFGFTFSLCRPCRDVLVAVLSRGEETPLEAATGAVHREAERIREQPRASLAPLTTALRRLAGRLRGLALPGWGEAAQEGA